MRSDYSYQIIQKVFSGFFILIVVVFLISCVKKEREPKVVTKEISAITTTSAIAKGDIIDLGDGITDHGHCWSLSTNPTITDSRTSIAAAAKLGIFESELSDLEPGKTYHVKAYVKSGNEVFYGTSLPFTTPGNPVYLNASVGNGTPSVIEITYDVALVNILPAQNSFSVKVNNVDRNVTSVAISGTTVQLTLSSPVIYGDVVTVAYTKPGINPIQTPSGGQAATIGAQTVTNNVNPPIPVYVSSVVNNATPTVVEITYSLSLAAVAPSTSSFNVQVNSGTRVINVVSVSGTKVQLTLASPVVYGDVVTVAYTKPGTNPIQTPSGGQAATISAQSVTNNVNPAIPVYISSVVENISPNVVAITYNLALAMVVPSASAFNVRVNGGTRSISSVSVSGTRVLLSLSSAVVYGDVITVSYTKPASNPLQSASGGQAASMGAQAVTNNINPVVLASVTTIAVTAITATTASSEGNITNAGGGTVTARGVCWATTPSPTVSGSHTSDGTGTGAFSSNITGLLPNTQYFLRAYATNSAGTSYGNEFAFTTASSPEISDIDGNTYQTVTIGTQVWMAENLKTRYYNDGNPITNITDGTQWLNSTEGAYCWYNNDAGTYNSLYGTLYNWYAVNTGKLCPTGWSVPDEAQWTTLANFLGGYSIAGDKLKEAGTVHWQSPNTGASNESGFTALPGGYRFVGGSFYAIGQGGLWWSSTEKSLETAFGLNLGSDNSSLNSYDYQKWMGFSVRCIKD
jgi:uncharacterized protein (TIGR02145 family)/uncharacterized repeat protein (TIGR02059 family)